MSGLHALRRGACRFSKSALMESDATNEQLGTTVCFTDRLLMSTTILGCCDTSPGRTHLANTAFCLADS